MTNAEQDMETLLGEQLRQIAPDIGLDEVDRDADMRDEFDIDSIDFLNLVSALGKSTGTNIPEADYPKIMTFNSMVAYLQELKAS